MQSASSTSSSRQLATTPTMESSLSSVSKAYGGGRGGDNDPPPSFPKFNLPDSYWSRPEASFSAELLSRPSGLSEFLAQHVAQSSQIQAILFEALEGRQEDRENDPRSRIQDSAFQIAFRPIQIPDISLSADALAQLRILKDSQGEEPQLQSSTSTTTSAAATATQQNNAASGCCIPPACTIL
jgi:hypothetical protein